MTSSYKLLIVDDHAHNLYTLASSSRSTWTQPFWRPALGARPLI